MRSYLADGEYIVHECLAIVLVWGAAFYWGNNVSDIWLSHNGAIAKLATFIATALGSISFALRSSLISYTTRLIEKSTDIDDIESRAIKSFRKITHFLLLSFVAAAFSLFSIFYAHIVTIFISLCLFSICVLVYTHLVFTFEQLEMMVIKAAKLYREHQLSEQIAAKIAEDKQNDN